MKLLRNTDVIKCQKGAFPGISVMTQERRVFGFGEKLQEMIVNALSNKINDFLKKSLRGQVRL